MRTAGRKAQQCAAGQMGDKRVKRGSMRARCGGAPAELQGHEQAAG